MHLGLPDIAKTVAEAFFGGDIPKERLDAIVTDTLNFDIPLKKMDEDIYVLELFHGPTFAFKDVGARFMARMLSYFVKEQQQEEREGAGSHLGRHRQCCSQRLSGRGRNSGLCALPLRKGERYPGSAVHHVGTKYCGAGN